MTVLKSILCPASIFEDNQCKYDYDSTIFITHYVIFSEGLLK